MHGAISLKEWEAMSRSRASISAGEGNGTFICWGSMQHTEWFRDDKSERVPPATPEWQRLLTLSGGEAGSLQAWPCRPEATALFRVVSCVWT